MRFLLIVAAIVAAEPNVSDWEQFETIRRSYEYEALDAFINKVDSGEAPGLLAEALLTKAEWLRIDFEELPDDDHAGRQELGDAIDELAKRGLDLCAAAPVTSEWLRRSADLRGTLIRSKYRAKKHRETMEAEAEAALQLDPRNARAYVTRAKLYLFADDRHGGDIEQAILMLEQAVALEPTLEQANLLRAYAHEQDNRFQDAQNLYEQVLLRNPNCRPAQQAIRRLSEAQSEAQR